MIDYCLTCRKQDPHERILLWLNDIDLNQLYPTPVTQDAIPSDIDDKEEKQEKKPPILPPLKAPCCKQSQSDVAPCHKQSQLDVAPCRKQSQGNILPCNKQGQGDTKNLKEMKLTLPEKPK